MYGAEKNVECLYKDVRFIDPLPIHTTTCLGLPKLQCKTTGLLASLEKLNQNVLRSIVKMECKGHMHIKWWHSYIIYLLYFINSLRKMF